MKIRVHRTQNTRDGWKIRFGTSEAYDSMITTVEVSAGSSLSEALDIGAGVARERFKTMAKFNANCEAHGG